ncbi:conserved hypothetical protein [Gloeothece citriformis PCC 7424]|uniref:Uncharacterized protein n=1 Tax=Gloeothece citriformis (strain PCC 7424) TaxID=65393 RepID=B7KCL4_GLOC7|nr:hypothetical protein [Gloeothece citriformis]ACK71565.1 conserved hypothetical protein [Gloeothece citriformis PCC 7424]
MARYTCSYRVKTSLTDLETLLKQLLKDCDFEVTYHTLDYMMAREIPGKVPFGKLVTVEVLIDSTTATKNQVQLSLVVKNDELPLQLDNHCRKLFEGIQQVIAKNYQWQLVESVPS